MVNWNQMIQRLIRIAKFDNTVWADIEHDENANAEAIVIVVIASLLSALGVWINTGQFGQFILRLLAGTLLNWLLWSWVTQIVGTKLFGGEATFWEMGRTLGYANAPAALGILSVIPCLGAIISLITLVFSLVIGFLAVREALDLPSDKALLTIVIGWVIMVAVNLLLMFVF